MLLFAACSPQQSQPNIVATTMPVYTFTGALCEGTTLQVGQLVNENISCLHDYTLTVKHMKMLESAELIVISGGGLEDFLEDALPENKAILDASEGIHLHHSEHAHQQDHHHDSDPHYWLSPENARSMAHAICDGLKKTYPQFSEQFNENMEQLDSLFTSLEEYARTNLSSLSCRQLITFHDGFSYMAEGFDLTILKSIEEESGNEASAKDLIEICDLVSNNHLPAIFIEKNGSDSAASVIARETGAEIYSLDMAISGEDYFSAMYQNINTLKEALG